MPQQKSPLASVGKGGVNHSADVRQVQWLLNATLRASGGTLLAVDGIAGPLTNGAIDAFQRSLGMRADGRVDPAGPTVQALFSQYFGNIWQGLAIYRSGLPSNARLQVSNAEVLQAEVRSVMDATKAFRGRATPGSTPRVSPPPRPNSDVA